MAHLSSNARDMNAYAPGGAKVAVMNGQALDHAYVRLPGGSEAIFTSSGLSRYRE